MADGAVELTYTYTQRGRGKMKILKQGSEQKLRESRIKKHRIMIFECYWCGCKWEADVDEGEVHSNQIDEDYATCPFCKNTVYYEG